MSKRKSKQQEPFGETYYHTHPHARPRAQKYERKNNAIEMKAQGWSRVAISDNDDGPAHTVGEGFLGFSAKPESYEFALTLFGHEHKYAHTGAGKKKPEIWARGEGFTCVEGLQAVFDRITRIGSRKYTFKEIAVGCHENPAEFRALDALLRLGQAHDEGGPAEDLIRTITRTITTRRAEKANKHFTERSNMRLYILRLSRQPNDGPKRLVIRAKSSTAARRLAAKETSNNDWLDAEKSLCTSLQPIGKPGVILVQ